MIKTGSFNKDSVNYKIKNRKTEKTKLNIDINFCDEAELQKLNGIGEVLSARIIKYRNLLGGFVTIDQLKEIYGLSDETYESIKDQIVIDVKLLKRLKSTISTR
ncbi:MAG: helix-hairpin-helix domain-containing protein [Saprospiraceae bacterium]